MKFTQYLPQALHSIAESKFLLVVFFLQVINMTSVVSAQQFCNSISTDKKAITSLELKAIFSKNIRIKTISKSGKPLRYGEYFFLTGRYIMRGDFPPMLGIYELKNKILMTNINSNTNHRIILKDKTKLYFYDCDDSSYAEISITEIKE